MNSKVFKLLLLASALSGCVQPSGERPAAITRHEGPVRISGAYALYPLLSLWVTEYQKSHPGAEFELTAKGSGVGLNDLVAGRIDLAMVSSETLPAFDSLLWMTPVARIGVVLITSSQNPYLPQIKERGLTRSKLAMTFTADPSQTWGEWFGNPGSDPVHPIVRNDSSGATDQLARFLWQVPSDLTGIGVTGEDAMIAAVRDDPFALGYCNFIYAFDPASKQFTEGIVIVPLDREQKGQRIDSYYDSVPSLQRAMWSGKYPAGLIRNLGLASMGKPASREIVEFLQWVLQDGQRLVAREGYIEVPSSQIRCRLESLKQ